MVTSNCYKLQTTKDTSKKDTKEPDPSSSQDFIIHKKKTKIGTSSTRKTSARATRKRKMLTQAAAAAGQKKVSDYFLTGTESEESQVVTNFFFGSDDDSNTLPDLVKNRSPSYIVIDSSDDNVVPIVVCQVSGPQHVSSPAKHVCVCDCPSLSPINHAPRTSNQNECVIIADSTTT